MEQKYIIFTENIHGNLSNTIKGFEKTLAEMNAKEREDRRKIDGSVHAMQEFAKWYEKNK